ncbi:MAG: hypothetical protein HP493_12850 [Nitrospira sp.]|nr:hypothetical protein [Nitrospira sp.]
MTQEAPTQAVMGFVARCPECDLEEIVHNCAGLTWNQIFLEIDRLSREGDVILTLQGRGQYRVTPSIRHS